MNKQQIEQAILRGLNCELDNRLDAAYTQYLTVAEAGEPLGMYCIGNLYFHKGYQGVPNLFAGIPLFPWSKPKHTPDYRKAYKWYLRAAEGGLAPAMTDVGVMRYSGCGCEKDVDAARTWLRKAAQAGETQAQKALMDFFGEQTYTPPADDRYAEQLLDFCRHVEEGDYAAAAELHGQLILGTDDQLPRLGYALRAGACNRTEAYTRYPLPALSTGRTCAPVTNLRGWYKSFIIINRKALGEHPVISYASDIYKPSKYPDYTPIFPLAGVDARGHASYEAGEYSWLRGVRDAGLLHLRPWTEAELAENIARWSQVHPYDADKADTLREILKGINLQPWESLFIETGEKEYAVEIGHVKGDSMQLVHRFVVDGYEPPAPTHVAHFCLLEE